MAELEQRAWRQRQGLEPDAPPALTFAEAARQYRESVRHMPSYRIVESTLRLHIEPALGRKLLTEITPADVDALVAQLRPTLAPATIRQVLNRIGAVYTWARRMRLYRGEDPTDGVTRVEVPRTLPRVMTAEQLRAVMAAAGRWRLMFLFTALTGARKGEVCGLLWTDLDLDSAMVYFRRSYDRPTTKGRRERAVPLPAVLVEALRAEKASARSVYVFPGEGGRMHRGTSFRLAEHFQRALCRAGLVKGYRMTCRRPACRHTEDSPSKESRDCPRCGWALWPVPLPMDFTFRHLRSSYGTHLGDLRAAQELLGHSNPNTTALHYFGVSVEKMRERVEALPLATLPGEA